MGETGHLRRSVIEPRFDVVVIGGGISGIAIARECARVGRQTLLLEQHDFASGTTSRTTRIIHGGLRYLEHAEIGLVRESLRERNRLLRERSHLVRPMRFVLAVGRQHSVFSLRGALAIRAALKFYTWFSAPRDRRARETQSFDNGLDLGNKYALFDYEDAQCEFPERLAAEWLVEAAQAGAVVRNYAAVLEVRRNGSGLRVRFRDLVGGNESVVESHSVINATGPWVDQVCRSALSSPDTLIAGVRGSHLLLDRFCGSPSHAIYTEASDGRPFFIIPWNGELLVGTTEVRDEGDPVAVAPAPEEIRYLLQSFNRLFPHHAKTHSDVLGTFSGIRPLPRKSGTEMGAVTRRSFIHDHADDGMPNFYSIIGGKLTTAAALARQCARKLGIDVKEAPIPLVRIGPPSGFESTLDQWSHEVAKQCGVSPASARGAAEWQGGHALSILRRAATHRALAQPIVESTEHLLAEAVHAVEAEYALTLGDILLRRVPIALTGKWTAEDSLEAAKRIGKVLQWSDHKIGFELEMFEAERQRLLRPARQPGRFPAPAEHLA